MIGSHKPKLSSILNKTKLMMKLFHQGEKQSLKDFFNERLEKLFESTPSNFGYKVDIESLLNDLGITKEHLFHMAINCLSKSVRNKQEIKIIASYLFFMQDFLKLIKAKGVSEKEHILLKDLLTLSEAMVYEKQQKNTVLMRYGEKGSTAFIILNGQVDVLIETSCFKDLGEKGYLYYLANLIKYHEFGLVNLAVNDNFKKYPMEIIDDITIKTNNNKNFNNHNYNTNISSIGHANTSNKNVNHYSTKDVTIMKNNTFSKTPMNNNIQNKLNNDINNINKTQNLKNNEFFIRRDKNSRTLTRQRREEDENNEILSSSRNEAKVESQKGVFKLNFMNEELKDLKKVKKYRAKELLEMFGLKFLDKRINKKLNHCTTEEFIERLNVCQIIDKKNEEKDSKKREEINLLKLKKYSEKTIKEIKKDEENKDNNEKEKNEDDKENNKNNKEKSQKSLINKESNKTNVNISNKDIIIENKDNITEKKDNEENKEKKDNKNIEDNKSKEDNENMNKSSSSSSSFLFEMNLNVIFGLKIFSYMKVVTLGKGALFGEMALNDASSLRKAAIITSSDCHFSVLNKKTFNNCIRMGAQKHLRELLQFFIELPIFSGIPEGVFYHKYYTNLSKFTITKGKKIITQGEKPEHITLLQTGLYGLTTRMSLYDLTRLIFKYARYFNVNNDAANDKKNKKKDYINIINDMKSKYRVLFQDVLNIMNEENSLLTDNFFFKRYYYSQQYIRIAEISCPEVIMNEEYMDDNGLFAFSIEAKAPENIIYTLNNSFYFDLKDKNLSVKKNQDKLLSKKINLMIQRLLIIRNSLINSFFDYKSKYEVGASVIRELEDMILTQLKKKRSLVKKDEKIIKTNENESKENKEKETYIHLNTNINICNNYLLKNKKSNKETCISLVDNNSYSNNNKNDKKKSKIKLYKEFEKNIKKNNKNKKSYNKKMNSFKTLNNKNSKFKNNYLNIYKKELSPNRKKNRNITNKELNSINQLPFKDNEEDILFSSFDSKDTKGNYIINNYNNKIASTDYGLSRNYENEFAQIKKKEKGKIFHSSFGDKLDDKKNNAIFPTQRHILMNNLIWENIKSVMKSDENKLNFGEYYKTTNNFYKNLNYKNYNYRKYLENNLKCIVNRNPKKIVNAKTVDNKMFIKTYNKERTSSISKDFSFSNIVIKSVNSGYLVSSPSIIKHSHLSIKSINKKISEKSKPHVVNLKKNIKKNGPPNIQLKLKKFFSPQEVNFMRMSKKMRNLVDANNYNKIKEEKFQINRNDYYKKNIKNRMNFFYGNTFDEK